MKIGIVTSTLSKTDGWGRYSFEVIRQLQNYGKVRVICRQPESMDGIDFYPVLPFPLTNPLKMIWYSYTVAKYLIYFVCE